MKIVIPMAGKGSRFSEAGYTFPKPLIDIQGKTMIEVVANNLKPDTEYSFVFIVQKEHYDQYDLYNILNNATGRKCEIIKINGITEGAACTVLSALKQINNDEELIIANSDQFIDVDIDKFIEDARNRNLDGSIMSFKASHPKWSYARTNEDGKVLETAEKKLISDNATVGIYYFKRGKDFVESAQSMIHKNIRHNGEFYVCPAFNEMILKGKDVFIYEIEQKDMHGLGTPVDLEEFLNKLNKKEVQI